jgi:prepilin-type N-terminal cleavage/methylation domain-containing protein
MDCRPFLKTDPGSAVNANLDSARRKHPVDDGFTLVEILVVVVIIGVLIAIAIPLYLRTKQVAYSATAKADLKTVELEEQNYYANSSAFASTQALITANPKLKLSDGSVAAVVWVSADGFCIASANAKGPREENAPFANLGYPYRTFFFDSSTGAVSNTLCPTPSGAAGLDGHYLDDTGGH